jgi:predicted component of type VI protein secretion system
MTGLELFGFAAVTVMVTAYALEQRSSAFVLLFAVSCLAAAAYAALIHSWPFAVVETIWSGIALSRWLRRRAQSVAAGERADSTQST